MIYFYNVYVLYSFICNLFNKKLNAFFCIHLYTLKFNNCNMSTAQSYSRYSSEISEHSVMQPLDTISINFDEVIRIVTGRYMYDIQFSRYMGRYIVIWTNNPMMSVNQ